MKKTTLTFAFAFLAIALSHAQISTERIIHKHLKENRNSQVSTANKTFLLDNSVFQIEENFDTTHKVVYKYDNQRRKSVETTFGYLNSDWIETQRRLFTYDSRDNVVLSKEQVLMNGVWETYSVDSSAFDSKNNETYNSTKFLVNGSLEMRFGYRTAYTYTPSGYISTRISEIYDEDFDTWMLSDKDSFLYDQQNRIANHYFWYYDEGDKKWELMYRTGKYTYNSMNLPTELFYQMQFGTQWIDAYKETYTYNAAGQILTMKMFQRELFSWNEVMNSYFIYDTRGNLIEEKAEYNFMGDIYINGYKAELTYDSYDNITEIINYSYDMDEEDFVLVGKVNHNYLDVTSVKGNKQFTTNINLYPNPAQNILNIELASEKAGDVVIQIFDLNGKRIFHQVYSNHGSLNSYEIPVEHFSPGFYVVNILEGENSTSRKFAKN